VSILISEIRGSRERSGTGGQSVRSEKRQTPFEIARKPPQSEWQGESGVSSHFRGQKDPGAERNRGPIREE